MGTTDEEIQRERAASDFLSMVSHELRTPLTSIIGFTDVLLSRGVEDDPEASMQLIGRVRARATHMHTLVEQLLEASRIDAGRVRLNIRPTRVEEAVRRYAEEVPKTSAHEMLFEVEQDLPEVECDAERVGVAVSNLVANAVKFSPDGGRITVAVTSEGDRARIAVGDEGIGIRSEDLDAVFERFVQGPEAVERRVGGVGLGLYLVRSITDDHGGSVVVDSFPGKGSVFAIELPFRQPAGPVADDQ